MRAIQDFQQRLYANYRLDLALPPTYKYLYGNPVRPVVPLNITLESVFIIGSYPAARFATVRAERDVPVEDIYQPFSTGRYFDGSRVRTISSGVELDVVYLAPLGLRRQQCWITNLVRVFLFREEHIAKYRRLGCQWPEQETRSQFELYARQGLGWLAEELALARPRLVITLGEEVAAVLHGVTAQAAQDNLLDGQLKEFRLDSAVYPVIHLAHPAAVMRTPSDLNPWPVLHRNVHLPSAQETVKRLIG